jgi:hypothetical protein
MGPDDTRNQMQCPVWVKDSPGGRGCAAAHLIDRRDHRFEHSQQVGAEALGLAIQTLLQPVGLADQVGQAAQALIQIAIGPKPVAHQPTRKRRAEHLAHHLHRALADHEQGGLCTGEDPQPEQLAVLLPTGLVGVQQVDVADGRRDLLLDHRRDRTPAFMHALIDGRRGELQAEPVEQEFAHPRARQAHALGQEADEDDQRRTGQMPLGQRHRPLRLVLGTPGLGLRHVPADAAALQVRVFGLAQDQPGRTGTGLDQVDRIAGIVRTRWRGRTQRLPAAAAATRRVRALGVDVQALGAAMSGRTGTSPGTPRRRARLIRSRWFLGRSRRCLARGGVAVGHRGRVGGFRIRGRHLAGVAPLPRRARARRARTVRWVLIEPLARRLQIRQGAPQQCTRLLRRKTVEVRLVELSQIMIAEVHTGRKKWLRQVVAGCCWLMLLGYMSGLT